MTLLMPHHHKGTQIEEQLLSNRYKCGKFQTRRVWNQSTFKNHLRKI
jgi:hypothetical protein